MFKQQLELHVQIGNNHVKEPSLSIPASSLVRLHFIIFFKKITKKSISLCQLAVNSVSKDNKYAENCHSDIL